MVKTNSRSFSWIWIILFSAFLIRLPGVFYGLPYHLIGDEETNVFGALQMIQLHTLLPVLHQSAFAVLYEPPLLAYIFALVFTPTLLAMYLFAGLPSIHTFTSLVTLDPSPLWIVGRLTVLLFSLGTIYFVYRLGKEFFKSERVGLVSALFFATSYLSTAIASTTRSWTPGTFTSVVGLWCVWHAFNAGASQRLRWLALGGLALGASFGFSYLPFYVPVIAFIIIYFSWKKSNLKQTLIETFIYGSITALPFLACVAIFLGVDPYPFHTQVTHHVIPSIEKTPWRFLGYYVRSLWNFELPLFLGSLTGIVMLVYKKNRTFLALFGLFFASVLVPMYTFLPNIDRYWVSLLPIVALIAGYGVVTLSELFPQPKSTKILQIILILLSVYTLALFIRYDYLLIENDSRVAAKNWIETNLPEKSTIILDVDSGAMRLSGTSASLAIQNSISSSSLRSPDRVLLADDTLAQHPFNLFTIHNAPLADHAALIQAALDERNPNTYLVEDSWATTTVAAQFPTKQLIKTMYGSTELPRLEVTSIGGDSSEYVFENILTLFYTVSRLGPDVEIYKISSTSTPARSSE